MTATELTPEDEAIVASVPEEARPALEARLAATYEGAPRTPRPDPTQGRTPRQDVSPEDVADARRDYAAMKFADFFSGRG